MIINNKIVFVRHGESLANIENRFSGWLDIDLTNKGYNNAYKLGIKLKKNNYFFDICYTSMLKRSIKTAWGILDGLNLTNIPIIKSLNLNERHYGELSGLNKTQGIKKYSKEKIYSWLNEYESKPPRIDNTKYTNIYKKYKLLKIPKNRIPYSESLNDSLARILKFWNETIKNKIKHKKILIVSHSNVLKVLIKYLSKDSTNKVNLIPNTTPLIYEFDKNLNILNNYLL